MPVSTPKRRKAFKPIGWLRAKADGGRKGVSASLNLTAMVDMFTVIVIFLLQSFSANGEIMFIHKDLTLPVAENTEELNERGVVITVTSQEIILEGKEIARVQELVAEEPVIPAMVEKLTGIRENEEKLAAARGQPRDASKPYEGAIIVQADEEVDFLLVRKVIGSLNQAGWAKVKFAATAPAVEGGEE
jgi:biopolymer transport protein ExbD